MQSLDDIIRDLVAKGEMSHISLVSHGKVFSASFVMCSKFGVSLAEHEDPVEALRLAMTKAKMKHHKTPDMKPTKEGLIAAAEAVEAAAEPDTENADDLM